MSARPPDESVDPTDAKPAALPPGWLLESTEEGVRLSWRAELFDVLPAIAGVVIGAVTLFQESKVYLREGLSQGVMVIAALCLVTIAVAAYASYAKLRNATVAEVSGEGLSIRSAPVAWFGSRAWPLEELGELIAQRRRDGDSPAFGVYRTAANGRLLPVQLFRRADQADFFRDVVNRAIHDQGRPADASTAPASRAANDA